MGAKQAWGKHNPTKTDMGVAKKAREPTRLSFISLFPIKPIQPGSLEKHLNHQPPLGFLNK